MQPLSPHHWALGGLCSRLCDLVGSATLGTPLPRSFFCLCAHRPERGIILSCLPGCSHHPPSTHCSKCPQQNSSAIQSVIMFKGHQDIALAWLLQRHHSSAVSAPHKVMHDGEIGSRLYKSWTTQNKRMGCRFGTQETWRDRAGMKAVC